MFDPNKIVNVSENVRPGVLNGGEDCRFYTITTNATDGRNRIVDIPEYLINGVPVVGSFIQSVPSNFYKGQHFFYRIIDGRMANVFNIENVIARGKITDVLPPSVLPGLASDASAMFDVNVQYDDTKWDVACFWGGGNARNNAYGFFNLMRGRINQKKK